MADKYTKLEGTPPKEGDSFGKTVRPREDSDEDADVQRCCGVFSIKVGFHLYGILDFVWFILVIVHLIRIKDETAPEDKKWSMAVLVVYLLKCILFIVVLVEDKSLTRKIYSSLLMFKMVAQSITVPLLALRIESDLLFDKVCNDELLLGDSVSSEAA